MNVGRIDMDKLERLAKSRGITYEELQAALKAHKLTGVAFITGSAPPLLPSRSS